MSKDAKSNSRLVYSSEQGRVEQAATAARPAKGDGVVRIMRQTKGRKGKGVCLITGVPLPPAELEQLGKRLKQRCGAGGTVKDGVIEIQGDKRELLAQELKALGYTVKLAGG